ncbi:MAG: V-type ATP synthase subunit A [SAR324 cluster bacterium]|nr:V-type ATP synthase subunit A [SAR324 cluster bacterium]
MATGIVLGINANLVKVKFKGAVRQNEIAYLQCLDGDLKIATRLKSEVIRIKMDIAEVQVFEDTKGLKPNDPVEFTGELLSVELGPGLLGQVFDGLQNPLELLAKETGFFTPRGFELPKLEKTKKWCYQPTSKLGDKLTAGEALGKVKENAFDHLIMIPFALKAHWEIAWLAEAGDYDLTEVVAKIKNSEGMTKDLTLVTSWPVKWPIAAFKERLKPNTPLTTQIRLVDSLFPICKGGTYAIPGPFGAGKTVLQQLTSRFAQVDIVIIAACGERANEVVETIKEFPKLIDPQTGKSLMERTIIICNTSSMPVAARESSVYTAVTLAEYYRQMGLDVLLLADSTSRWAQALRERSGRLEEIPGEEAFPAYLESVIASFYERAGLVELKNGKQGSVTIGGTVSPAGGNFEEPVTKATLKVVGAFHALSRERSDARKFPAIHPLESWTKYQGQLSKKQRDQAIGLLFRSSEIEQMMKVVGEEGTTLEDFWIYLKGELFDQIFVQQNAFDPVDTASPEVRQKYLFDLLTKVIACDFRVKDKEAARKIIQQIRQSLIDFNAIPWEEDQKISEQAEKIKGLLYKKEEAP